MKGTRNPQWRVSLKPHQQTDPPDLAAVVGGQPGFVLVQVGVGHVEHVEAEGRDHPHQRRRPQQVAVENNAAASFAGVRQSVVSVKQLTHCRSHRNMQQILALLTVAQIR